jgi:arylsulfatase A-like enzyme
VVRSLLFIASLICSVHLLADTHAGKPNVILFLVDDMGWTDLGVYGSEFYETPNIDAFAAQGVRFTNAYAAGHVCSPTRASLMTGKYPARLHLTDWLPGRRSYDFETLIGADKAAALAADEVTLAETFKTHGYRTGIFGKWHLGDEPAGPTSQGFDVQVPQWNGCCPRGGYHPPYKMDGLSIEGREDEYVTDRLTELAVDFIRESRDRPYFLYLSHFAVHDPIQGREDLVTKYERKLSRLPDGTDAPFVLEGNPDDRDPLDRAELDLLITKPSHQAHTTLPKRTVKVKQRQDNVAFAAMVESVDESLGRVLHELQSSGQMDNTIIVFYSDNGGMSAGNFGKPDRVIPDDRLDRAYATSNLPLRGAKGWLYEGGIRVPLIVRWPEKGRHGSVSDLPVISADFYPTLLEMANLPPEAAQHVDGVSFATALQGIDAEPHPLYWHFPHYSNHGMQSPGGAIRVGPYKLLEYFENGTIQLFNLNDDPGEQRDLATVETAKAKQLLTQLQTWRSKVGANMPRPR